MYDVYRVASYRRATGRKNRRSLHRLKTRLRQKFGAVYTSDTGLSRNQPYYYIVQARDLNNGRIDTNNTGNRVVRVGRANVAEHRRHADVCERDVRNLRRQWSLHARASGFGHSEPESACIPTRSEPRFQWRVFAGMYAPDFSPGDQLGLPDPAGTHHGGASDFSAIMGPFNLTADSVMEFDHFFNTESAFDGGVMEVGTRLTDALSRLHFRTM